MTETVYIHPAPPPASWWELYLGLADHGHRHRDLAPVEIHRPSPELSYHYPDIVASLEVDPQPDGRDATAFACWVESLDVVYTLDTRRALDRGGDIVVTAVGLLGTLTVSLWTVIRGTTTLTDIDQVDDDPAAVTVEALRAYDEVRHPAFAPTDFVPPADTTGEPDAADVPAPVDP